MGAAQSLQLRAEPAHDLPPTPAGVPAVAAEAQGLWPGGCPPAPLREGGPLLPEGTSPGAHLHPVPRVRAVRLPAGRPLHTLNPNRVTQS